MLVSDFRNSFSKYSFPKLGYIQIPKISIPAEDYVELSLAADANSKDYLLALTKRGFAEKLQLGKIPADKKDIYWKQAEFELSEINKLLFTDYILLVYHIIRFCKKNSILNSPGRGCLVGSTKIKTENGYKKLQDILVGDKVLTSNSTFESVLAKFEYPISESLIGLKTFAGTHDIDKMTEDHKVLALKNPFKQLSNSYNEILGYRGLDLSQFLDFEKCEWIKASDVSVGDYLIRNVNYTENPNVVDSNRVDLAKFASIYDKDFVWEGKNFNQYQERKLSIMGIHKVTGIARSCLINLLKGRKSRTFTQEKLNKYLLSIGETMESFMTNKSKYLVKYPRYIDINEDFCYLFGFFIGDGWIRTEGSEIGFAFHSEDNLPELARVKSILTKYGFDIKEIHSPIRKLTQLVAKSKFIKALFCELCPNGNTYTKLIPKWMFSLPKPLLRELAQGLLDSDGSKNIETGRLCYDSVNEPLILQVRDLFEIIGLKTSISKRVHTNPKWSDSYKISPFNEAAHPSSRAYSDGKRIFLKVNEIIRNINGVDKVYDISIANHSNYQTSNFIVHNSCVGSLMLYFLGVTTVDPIKHELLFERFISSARTESKDFDGETYISSESLPDVDLDSDGMLKFKVNDFIETTFPNRNCSISNYGTLQGKNAIKEVAKMFLGYSEEEAKHVSDLVETKFGKTDSVSASLDVNEHFKGWSEKSPKNKEATEIACKLQGLLKNFSVHASGIILTDDTIDNTLPTKLSGDKSNVTAVDMSVAQLSGIKIDNLGLKNLSVIAETLTSVKKNMDDIDVNDPSIYQFIELKDQFYGIFQAQEGLGKQVLKSIKPKNVDDISLSIAIGRPGAMKFAADIVKARQEGMGEEFEKMPDPVKAILRESGGYVCYQEQIMKLCKVMAKFPDTETNSVRKYVSKKNKSKLIEYKAKFIEGSAKNGYKKELAETLWQSFEASGDYAFNKCVWPHETVELSDGKIIKLNQVKTGDYIKAFHVEDKIEHYVKVSRVYHNGVKSLFEWGFEDGYIIKCTENHKFFNGEKMVEIEEAYRKTQPLLTEDGYKFIVKKESYCEHETMDLEVDSPDHNYYCNGIVVSNSHSTGYAYLTAITAYLKANHPLEYFTAMLKNCKNEQDPISEIGKIQSELQHFGIKLLPPHIILSDLDFKMEGPNIRFGLGDIKGIAAKSMQKLLSFRDSKHANKFEIFESASAAKLNIGILSSLIQAGTLDDDIAKHKQTRSRLVLEAQVWRLLTTREKRFALFYAEKYNNDLLGVVLGFKDDKLKDDKGKLVLKESRFDTISRDYQNYKKIYLQNKNSEEFACWYYERKLLGFPYSSNLKTIFNRKNSNILSIGEALKTRQDGKVLLVGMVEETKGGVSKGKGTRWLRMTIRDESDMVNVLIFNDKIDNCKEVNNNRLPEEEDIIVVEGTRKSDCIFADFIKIQEHKVFTKLSDLKEVPVEKDKNIEATENAEKSKIK